jgi:hypothetical protein
VLPSVAAFIDRLIDYAGLFPPARLPMDQAVSVFSAARQGPYGEILARFICPAGRLADFEQAAAGCLRAERGGWQVSALAQGGTDRASFELSLNDDLAAVSRFPQSPELACRVDAIEMRLPERADPAQLIDAAVSALAATTLRPFFEIPWSAGGNFLEEALRAIQRSAARFPAGQSAPGAKIRTGGVTADQVPGCDRVAEFIAACRRHGVAMKATAGLHHAVRAPDEQVGATQHGFLNVFTAAVAACVHGAGEDTLIEILACPDAQEFRFDDQAMNWRGLRLEARQIEQARRQFAVSYGSCSLDEPIDDLCRLGLLSR